MSALASILILIVSLNGCKKNENKEPEEKSEVLKEIPMDQVPQWSFEKSKEAGKKYTVRINQTFPLFFADGEGNKLSPTSREMLQCLDPDDDDYWENELYLNDIDIMYDCDPTLDLVVKLVFHWQVSTAVNLLTVDPNNPSNLSRGRIRLKNSSGTYYYTNNSITPISLGTPYTDPENSDKQIYDMTYAVTIPFATWNSAVSVEHRPIIYTNCALDATVSPGWIGSFTPNYVVVDVCDKIDYVFINAEGSGRYVYFHGADEQWQFGPSCYPNTTVRPHEHEIQWKKVGDPTYFAYSTVVFDDPYLCTPDLPGNLSVIAVLGKQLPVSGNITFHYRNVKRSSSNGCTSSEVCTGPWSDEIIIMFSNIFYFYGS